MRFASGTDRHPGLNIHGRDPDAHRAAEPVIFGFWIFLMSDLVLFALLMATYASMSLHGIAGGPTPRQAGDLASAGVETALLLASSFTFSLTSLALKYRDDRRALVGWMALTGLLGLGFLGCEAKDFASLIGKGWAPELSGFLSAHFTLLGTHFLHVACGLAWMAVMFVQIAVRGLDQAVATRIMRLALFWHLLDVVWIGIVTLVFLQGSLS
ncbi:cytochrome c oxidase subunit 3 [Novosphingobium profundi]|uniref:cytochrome c oxidase subunit 3 n=1 Tax=Novosphingobium profundi TaxID=1774954 RepID=UPI001BDB5012|nr:cytochrome c oxidase subunit 3 [Novosphingobium profundi]MBT0670593.1 cytochrome c oxidase subunit 3 [Novosphingobium profundi]